MFRSSMSHTIPLSLINEGTVEIVVKTPFEEAFSPQLFLKGTDWVKNFKSSIFHIIYY